ncbi:hypothetical protein [Embleya scabrispora]|uniref:hypothetical protein n=1 Tax=Embleya scabrispora TaxID=159449 RepID=UPI00036293E0|nr:hypothetical protein [Embleya scabrispora]MYS80165.1 hypothetical protein [Streptomyces sp. SID5474]
MHAEVVVVDPRNDSGERAFALTTPEAAVVVAAASSEPVGGCGHGMDWFLRRLGVHLLARLTDRPDRGISDCLADTIAETAALHGARCDLAHDATPAASVVACRVLVHDLQYLVLGPGMVQLHHAGGPTSRMTGPDGPLAAVRARPSIAAHAGTGTVRLHTLTGASLTADATGRPGARVTLTFRPPASPTGPTLAHRFDRSRHDAP